MAIRRSHKSRSKKVRKQKRQAFLRGMRKALHVETLEQRQLLAIGPQLVGINPNEGEVLQHGDVRHVAPLDLTIRFDEGQAIDPASLGGIRITRSGPDDRFENQSGVANDVVVEPGYIGIGEQPNEVIVRFAEALPDNFYRIEILGTGDTPLTNIEGDVFDNDRAEDGVQNVALEFSLDLGGLIQAVVPQPITRDNNGNLTQARNQIVVYFNDDNLVDRKVDIGAENPQFYQLIYTSDSATNTDDGTPFHPVSVSYDVRTDTAVLTFEKDLAELGGAGTYRLRIGNAESKPLAPVRQDLADVGSSFDTAHDLTNFDGSQGLIIRGAVSPQTFTLDLPGASDEPGHRDSSQEDHVGDYPGLDDLFGDSGQADAESGASIYYYNFQDHYGNDPFGNPLHNLITDTQKQRAREIFSLYSYYSGVRFIETADQGLTIATGDMRALDPEIRTGSGGVLGLAGGDTAIMDNAESWDDSFGGNWFDTAMHEIGHLLGLGHSYDLPPLTVMGSTEYEDPEGNPLFGVTAEEVFPGDHDITHIRHLFRPDSIDIDLYRFELSQSGLFTAEAFAERLGNSSLLDSVISLYRETPGGRELIARNDDYFSEDSFVELQLAAGVYYVGVTASGNESFDPTVENTGFGGTSNGVYDLRLNFRPDVSFGISDSTGTLLDGDADGTPGGVFNFWFRAVDAANTIIVDKASTSANPDGTLANPFRDINDALTHPTHKAQAGDVVRIVGNGGADKNLSTLDDNLAYQLGFDRLNQPLDDEGEDGAALSIPKDVTVMVDAGAILKLRRTSINVGSFAPGIDRSGGALQVLGTPRVLDGAGGTLKDATGSDLVGSVIFTSYDDESLGTDTNPAIATTPKPGDWGGIRFRNDLDRAEGRKDWEARGIFLNHVNFADMRYGGGSVVINSLSQVVNPIDMINARPTVTYNTISFSADAAMAANPDSFEETNFHAPEFQGVPFTSDYQRIGPEIRGNTLADNTTNGLFVRVATPAGSQLERLNVAGRWDDTDIVHVLTETLVLNGTPGGPLTNATDMPKARLDASLVIDPGMVVKLDGARITAGMETQLLAEGTAGRKVVFTSLLDDRYGAGTTFDTNSNESPQGAAAGDWGGLYFSPTSSGSLDYTVVAYAGGISRVEGSFAAFNAIEIHQADVRIAHSTIEKNDSGLGGQAPADRFGRGTNAAGAIFIRGAQPIIIDNIIRDTQGPAITANVNALNHFLVTDGGRQRGQIEQFNQQLDNQGPLLRDNRLDNNTINGLVVRGGVLTTESVWDDTDIVHVLLNEIVVPNFHTYGGLRLESKPDESLVVKLLGETAGFTASGTPLEIEDRIGGMLHVVGQPGFPVVFTSLADDTVGAGFRNDGTPQTDTNNDGAATAPSPGDWRSLKLDQYAHDRNVAVVVEQETATAELPGTNGTPDSAQFLGALAPHEKAGDDNLRLGFNIHGFINQPGDVDVYSFRAEGGTEIWLDIDRTTFALDTVVELIDANGQVIALSDNSTAEDSEDESIIGTGRTMNKSGFLIRDFFSTNPRDAGLRVVLTGAAGTTNTYHVRVRSSNPDVLGDFGGGQTSGVYQLQIRLREMDELPGSSVQFADIRYATNGVEIYGLPAHSPLMGETVESTADNNTQDTAQDLGNLLTTDRGTISVGGTLSGAADVDWYKLKITPEMVQEIDDPWYSTIFDLDYADGLARANTRISVFDSSGDLVLTTTNSNVAEDQPGPLQGSDLDNLTGGSAGVLDPYLGTVEMRVGTYYVAISSDAQIPTELTQHLVHNPANPLLRLEPLDSVVRVAEDHIDFNGGSTAASPLTPRLLGPDSAVPYVLGDVVLFVVEDAGSNLSRLVTVDPFSGVHETEVGEFAQFVRDIGMRPDGSLFTFNLGTETAPEPTDANSAGYFEINTGDATLTDSGGLNLPDGDIAFEVTENGIVTSFDPSNDNEAGAGEGFGWQNTALTFRLVNKETQAWGVFSGGDDLLAGVPNRDYANMLLRFNPETGEISLDPEQNSITELDDGTFFLDSGNRITTNFSRPGNTGILTAEATGPGIDIEDGTQFVLLDGLGNPHVFEFDAGPELEVDFNLENGEFIQDEEFFVLDGVTFEFDAGAALQVLTGNAGFVDGQVFTLTNSAQNQLEVTFEFDSDENVDLASTAISLDQNDSVGEMAVAIANAINGAEFGVVATVVGTQVLLSGDSGLDAAGVAGLQVVGDYGTSQAGAIEVTIEEIFTPQQVRQAIFNAVDGEGIQVGYEDPRMNFPEVTAYDDSGAEFVTITGSEGSTAGAEINFLAQDTALDIARKIAEAVNAAGITGLTAEQRDDVVAFSGGTVDDADAPLESVAAAPGGFVTGIAFVGNNMYAVSDRGGLYRLENYNGDVNTQYIASSQADLEGIEFQGLVAGPSTEGGRYSDLLFAVDTDGRLYAFNTAGELQPIFLNGATSIQTGADNVEGLAFSTLHENPWKITDARKGDAGHGLDRSFNGSRGSGDDELSYYFGAGGSYDFPGGAHGSVITDTFDLAGYSAQDLPTLYFNYFLETEEKNGLGGNNPMLDAFRVFVSGDDGIWHLLATNNSTRNANDPDEYDDPNIFDDIDYGDDGFSGTIDVPVQELFDNSGSWRQARVNLAPFAGQDNLRLRFDFSTAGTFNLGDVMTGGVELRALPGAEISDGDTFIIDNETFEFDLEYVFSFHTGAATLDGDGFTINDGVNPPIVFEFDKDELVSAGAVPIAIHENMDASQVAAAVEQTLALAGLDNLSLYRDGARLNVQGMASITPSFFGSFRLDGTPGAFFGSAVHIHLGMTADEVAQAIAPVVESVFSGVTDNVARVNKDMVRILGHAVADPGVLGLSRGEPFGDYYLYGDQFGGFDKAARGQNNDFEGVYIDDLIIGFAERGEMVTGSVGDSGYTENPVASNVDIVEGQYQLEIRGGEEYATPSAFPPPPLVLERTFDTNDRLAQATTLFAPAGDEIADGDTFFVSDGINQVTFEFQDIHTSMAVVGDNVPLFFDPSDTAVQMAQVIRDAINSAAVQARLQVQAALSDGSASGADSTSTRIHLFGATVRSNVLSPTLLVPETTTDANALRDEILGAGITPIGNATLVGGGLSAGFFTGGRDVIGIESGIILTTGDATFAEGPNTDDSSSGFASFQGDADLNAEFGVVTRDTTYLEFDFETDSDDLFFRFVFASEEYNEFVQAGFNDVFAFFLDGENIALVPGTSDPISIDTINGGNPLGTNASNPSFYNNNDPDEGGRFLDGTSYDGFTAVFTATKLGLTPGTHTIKLAISDVGDFNFDSAVFIEAESFSSATQEGPREGLHGVVYDDRGDKNTFRDQGQVILAQNMIRSAAQFGIVVDAGASNLAHFGSVRNLRELNHNRWVPGVTITNNVLVRGGSGGIHFSGDANPLASVPFGRIVNNTIVGNGGGTGIRVTENASPTVLNNIVADFSQGLNIDESSLSTVVGGMLYQGNGLNSNVGLGDFAITLDPDDPLFVDAVNGNFYLEAGSAAIDSSIDSLEDRPGVVRVTDPLGIARSPILAPDRDVTGQLRVDDPSIEPPSGFGDNVFKDRGAIDRSDFVGPTATLLTPLDNDAAGRDRDPDKSELSLFGAVLREFAIQLLDSADVTGTNEGAGVDDLRVTGDQVVITRNGVALVEGTDYTFDYDATNNIIRLKPLAGVWASGVIYEITLNNTAPDGIRDLADNYLRPTRLTGETKFTVHIAGGVDFGDAPSNYPVTAADDGANHVVTGGLVLGSIIDVEQDGRPSADASGDGLDEDGVTFDSLLMINQTATFTVQASKTGKLDAWLDFNGDGDWSDPGEQIFTSVSVAAGSNSLSAQIPITARIGETFARFRLSTDGGLAPTGQAADGEVEDYQVTLGGNPWQNPVNRFDVNGNGVVTTLDALILINELSNPKYSNPATGDLPNPPAEPYVPGEGAYYVDVSGSSTPGLFRLSTLDVAQVISYLIAQANGNAQPGDVAELGGLPETKTAAPAEPAVLPPATGSSGAMTSRLILTTLPTFDADQFELPMSPLAGARIEPLTSSTIDVSPTSEPAATEEDVVALQQPKAQDEASLLRDDLDLSSGGAIDDVLTEIAADVDEAQREDSAREAAFATLWG